MARSESHARSWRRPAAVVLVLLATAAAIHLLSASDASVDDQAPPLAADADAPFDPIDLPEPNPGQVEALGPGGAQLSPKELLPPSLGGGRGPKREFAVRVVDRDGCGVPGAAVGVWTRNATHPYRKSLLAAREAYMARYYPGSAADADSLNWSWLVWADPTWNDPAELRKTDEDGSAVVSLPDSNVAIAATHATAGSSGRWIGSAWEALAGPDGSEPFELLLRIVPEGHLSGRVVDAAGEPLGGALVLMTRLGGRAGHCEPLMPRPVTCDEDGRFTLATSAPAFAYVYGLSRGQWSQQKLITVAPDANVDLTLRIGSASSVSGRVVDAHGDPVGGADVHASGPERAHEQTSSGDDGRFTLKLPQAGRWLMGATKDGLVPEDAVTLETGPMASEPVTLRVIEGASIRGLVRRATGEPVAGLMVSAHAGFKNRLDANRVFGLLTPYQFGTTDAEGRFEFANLHPALRFNVTAGREFPSFDKADAEEVAPGSFIEIEVDTDEPDSWTLDGLVLDDETGEPVPDFSVCVAAYLDSDGVLPFHREFRPFRAPDGRFHVDGIRRSPAYVRVVAAKYAERVVGPIALSPQPPPLEIRLGRPARLDVSVVDETGQGVAGAVVLLRLKVEAENYFDAPVAREATTDAAGRASWTGLPPETYSVQAVSDAGPTKIGTVQLVSGGQHVHTLTLGGAAKAGRLVVQARDLAGVAVQGVPVRVSWAMWEQLDTLPRRQKTNAEGEVVFSGLSPGRYSVFADISGLGAFEQVTIEAGATVTVEMKPHEP